jgi:formamidopyrimidine-DNA glycosylase
MPELPEVETVASALRPHLVDRKIKGIDTFIDKLRTPLTLTHDRDFWQDARITAVRRRSKYILIDLDTECLLLVHLGMTGSCRIESPDTERRKHDHVEVLLDDGQAWRFRDPRRFGRFELFHAGAEDPIPAPLRELGPEPFDDAFNAKAMHAIAKGRTAPVKAFIMDARRVVGVGNIYASEALFRAGISPHRAAGRISLARWQKLIDAVREVLSAAIRAGGTTIVDFEGVNGSEGLFEQELAVYGRHETFCPRCTKGTIRLTRIAGRSTYHCPACQR